MGEGGDTVAAGVIKKDDFVWKKSFTNRIK